MSDGWDAESEADDGGSLYQLFGLDSSVGAPLLFTHLSCPLFLAAGRDPDLVALTITNS